MIPLLVLAALIAVIILVVRRFGISNTNKTIQRMRRQSLWYPELETRIALKPQLMSQAIIPVIDRAMNAIIDARLARVLPRRVFLETSCLTLHVINGIAYEVFPKKYRHFFSREVVPVIDITIDGLIDGQLAEVNPGRPSIEFSWMIRNFAIKVANKIFPHKYRRFMSRLSACIIDYARHDLKWPESCLKEFKDAIASRHNEYSKCSDIQSIVAKYWKYANQLRDLSNYDTASAQPLGQINEPSSKIIQQLAEIVARAEAEIIQYVQDL
jgi:hypothetical protein